MKRMLLSQNNPGQPIDLPANLLKAYNDAIVKATNDFDDVRYELGAKNQNTGRVDCSGWIVPSRVRPVRKTPRLLGARVKKAALLLGAKWPAGSQITIRFLEGDAALEERVKAVAKTWTDLTNLKFIWTTKAPTDIRIACSGAKLGAASAPGGALGRRAPRFFMTASACARTRSKSSCSARGSSTPP